MKKCVKCKMRKALTVRCYWVGWNRGTDGDNWICVECLGKEIKKELDKK